MRLALALLMLAAGLAAAEDSPNAIIEEAVTLLEEQLDGRREELAENRQELYDIIDGILLPRFDRRFAAQLVLAKHWRTASEEQQTRFRFCHSGAIRQANAARFAARLSSMMAVLFPWTMNWSSARPGGSCSTSSSKACPTCATFAPSSIRSSGRRAWTR